MTKPTTEAEREYLELVLSTEYDEYIQAELYAARKRVMLERARPDDIAALKELYLSARAAMDRFHDTCKAYRSLGVHRDLVEGHNGLTQEWSQEYETARLAVLEITGDPTSPCLQRNHKYEAGQKERAKP